MKSIINTQDTESTEDLVENLSDDFSITTIELSEVSIGIKLLRASSKMPTYATSGSACMDLYSANEATIIIEPMAVVMIPTGIALDLPSNYNVFVFCRSSFASYKIIIPNAPGVVDSDYRGEIKVLLMNLGDQAFSVLPNTRIAQISCEPFTKIKFVTREVLSSTERGQKGFGSTGMY